MLARVMLYGKHAATFAIDNRRLIAVCSAAFCCGRSGQGGDRASARCCCCGKGSQKLFYFLANLTNKNFAQRTTNFLTLAANDKTFHLT
jgi:hypothetical protein